MPAFTSRFVYALNSLVRSQWFGGHLCPPFGDALYASRPLLNNLTLTQQLQHLLYAFFHAAALCVNH